MKKHLLIACTAVSFALFVSSCRMNTLRGEGNKTTAAPTLSSFNAIEIEVPLKANITVQSGAQPGIQMNGYENILKHITTTVKNNTLYVKCDLGETWTIDCDGLTTQITLPSLTSLTLTGAPDADIHGNVAGGNFKLDISGKANVTIDNINVDTFASDVSGAADITIKGGTVKSAAYEISGAAKVKAFPLQAGETVAGVARLRR